MCSLGRHRFWGTFHLSSRPPQAAHRPRPQPQPSVCHRESKPRVHQDFDARETPLSGLLVWGILGVQLVSRMSVAPCRQSPFTLASHAASRPCWALLAAAWPGEEGHPHDGGLTCSQVSHPGRGRESIFCSHPRIKSQSRSLLVGLFYSLTNHSG